MNTQMRHIQECRLCLSKLPTVASLLLNPTPPANEFVSNPEEVQDIFPLDLFTCSECGHVQLPYVVSPERLFRNYVYVSGTSPVFRQHFESYAKDMIQKFDLGPKDLVLEIGSNDGTLLRFFKQAGIRVLGIDPATAIAKQATADGIPTWNDFFNAGVADRILQEYGSPKLILANNVYAHVEDMIGLTSCIHELLPGDGAFVFEVSYLLDVYQKCLFDTIYHEHLSYHHVIPLIPFFTRLGLELYDVERVDSHGGSLRGYVRKHSEQSISFNVKRLIDAELFVFGPGKTPFEHLARRIEEANTRLCTRLRQVKSKNKRVAAFGAPAKATTLMYQFDLGRESIDFVVDDSPQKQGLFTPGKHIPVVKSETLYSQKPDFTVILAWNFADSIIRKHQAYLDQGGTFIVPLPEYREVSKGVY